jgi:AcrR family transcriptional regulator
VKPKPSAILPAKCRLPEEVRRAQLIEAAIRLFAQKGFQGTTTKEIAEDAGVNEALIFRYFHSKQDLYAAILDYGSSQVSVEQWIEELRPFAERRDDESVFSRLAHRLLEDHPVRRAFLRLMLYSALEQHELARMCRERGRVPLENFLAGYIESRQREGAFQMVNARAAALAFLGMCSYEFLRSILFGEFGHGISTGEAEAAFARLFLEGLGCPQTKEAYIGSEGKV